MSASSSLAMRRRPLFSEMARRIGRDENSSDRYVMSIEPASLIKTTACRLHICIMQQEWNRSILLQLPSFSRFSVMESRMTASPVVAEAPRMLS